MFLAPILLNQSDRPRLCLQINFVARSPRRFPGKKQVAKSPEVWHILPIEEVAMPLKKYIEIEWKEVRLKAFDDYGESNFFLNIATDYPTAYLPKNINEKLIADLRQQKQEDGSWIIHPKKESDRVLFSGYVENLLQVAVSVLESDEKSLLNIFSENAGNIAEFLKSGACLPGKFFPFFGIASLVFSGIASLIKDRNDFVGTFIYQLRRDTLLPIGRPLVGKILCGDDCVGEVDILIYIQPEETTLNLYYRDVAIFPFSKNEIAVYYSGDLTPGKQIYMIWTLDNWKSNPPLVKMKQTGKFWVAIIKIPDIEIGTQLELAFTDDKENWDNKDGNNWVFDHFRWI